MLFRSNLTDDADVIAAKVRRAKTDADALPSEVEGLANRLEADNLVAIFAGLAGRTKAEVLRDHGGSQFSTFKAALSDLAVERLSPIAAEMRRLQADPGYIDGVLRSGAERANAIAEATMRDVKAIVGLLG